jgi:hypothetical protein
MRKDWMMVKTQIITHNELQYQNCRQMTISANEAISSLVFGLVRQITHEIKIYTAVTVAGKR